MTATYTRQIHFSGRGNAVGMTAKGEVICCRAFRASKTYRVWIDGPLHMTDARTRSFDTLAKGKAYAASLLDESKTEELAWW